MALQGKTSPPDYLTESELIGLMEKHGIGTDASIAVHINNICAPFSRCAAILTLLALSFRFTGCDVSILLFTCMAGTQTREIMWGSRQAARWSPLSWASLWCEGTSSLTQSSASHRCALNVPMNIATSLISYRSMGYDSACMLAEHGSMQSLLEDMQSRSKSHAGRAAKMVCCVGQVRAHVERQIGLIAEGKAEKEAVVLHTLDQFAQKFRHFVTKIARMDALFEASFSPLASSGNLSNFSALLMSHVGIGWNLFAGLIT